MGEAIGSMLTNVVISNTDTPDQQAAAWQKLRELLLRPDAKALTPTNITIFTVLHSPNADEMAMMELPPFEVYTTAVECESIYSVSISDK